jgi:hypothetical protein
MSLQILNLKKKKVFGQGSCLYSDTNVNVKTEHTSRSVKKLQFCGGLYVSDRTDVRLLADQELEIRSNGMNNKWDDRLTV